MGICLHVVKLSYLIAYIHVLVLLVKIARSMVFQWGRQHVNISQSGNETGCVHLAHWQCITLCVCAGEDSEPGGQCGGNSGTHQPGNVQWTHSFTLSLTVSPCSLNFISLAMTDF